MRDPVLDELGTKLMHDVRDITLMRFKAILQGKMKDEQSKRLHELVQKVDPNQELAKALIPQVIDSTLHAMMFWFEQDPDFFLGKHAEDGSVIDMKEVSDGLAGELPTDNGWIKKYSQEGL